MIRQRSLVTLGAVALLAAGVGGSLLVRQPAGLSSRDVSLFKVERGRFVRRAVAEGYLRAVEATPVTVPQGVEGTPRIAWIAPDGSQVRKGDVVARLDTTALEQDLADGAADLEEARLRAEDRRESAERDQSDLLSDALLAEKESKQTETFAPRDPGVFSRREILDSEIDQELIREKIDNIRRKGDAVSRRNRNQMDLLRIQRSQADLKFRKAGNGMASAEIRAPHDGMLVLTRGWDGMAPDTGTEVWPGQELAELPDPSRMQVVAYVLEADATGLKAGCRATLEVEARPGMTIAARVDQVDPMAKRRGWRVPVQYFEVVLALEAEAAEGMKPGLRVQADIVTQETSAVLMVPPQAVFVEEGRERVLRREGDILVPVEVEVGDRGLARVVIQRGVQEGDQVALRDPRSGSLETREKRSGAKGPPRGPGATP